MVKLPKLTELLILCRPADLQEIAAARGIQVAEGTPQGDGVSTLAARLLDAASLRRAVDSLTPHERITWNTLVSAGGRIEGGAFYARFGRSHRREASGPYGQAIFPSEPAGMDRPAERLQRLGLAFSVTMPYPATYVPAEVMSAVGRPLPVPADPPRTIPAPAAFGPACDIIAALVVYLSYCRRHRVALTRDNELHQRQIVELGEMLWPLFGLDRGPFAGAEHWFLDTLRELLEKLRLIEPGDRGLMVLPGAEAWLASPRHQLMSGIWSAFYRDEDDVVYRHAGAQVATSASAVTDLRTATCDCLGRCPAGEWLSTADLMEYVYLRHPDIVYSWSDRASPFRLGEVDVAWPTGAAWSRRSAETIVSLLRKDLRWFGAVDVAADGSAFRITSLGAYLLGQSPAWVDEPQPRPLIVQPNFEVIVPAEAAPLTVYRLEQVADHVTRDRASIYVLTQSSVLRAMESGLSADQMLAFLIEASGRDLPQNVAYSIRGWADRYGEIEIRHMTVLQTAREDLIAELSSSARLKLSFGDRLGPRAVVVTNDNLPAVVTRLRKSGYSPRVGTNIDRSGALAAQSVTLPESELLVLVAAAMAWNEADGPNAATVAAVKAVQKCLSRSGLAQVESLRRSIRTVAAARAKPGQPRIEKPAARFPRTHTEPLLLKAIKERQPVTMEYYDGNASEFSLEVIYPRRIDASQGADLLYGETLSGGHEVAYLMDHIRAVRPGAYTPAPSQEAE